MQKTYQLYRRQHALCQGIICKVQEQGQKIFERTNQLKNNTPHLTLEYSGNDAIHEDPSELWIAKATTDLYILSIYY